MKWMVALPYLIPHPSFEVGTIIMSFIAEKTETQGGIFLAKATQYVVGEGLESRPSNSDPTLILPPGSQKFHFT